MPTEDDADTVVQPDVSVICDESKLTDQGCTGAPDFVVEILSPATAFKDMDEKCRLYEHHGVREYLIVNPANETVMVYVRDDVGPGTQRGTAAGDNGGTQEAKLIPGTHSGTAGRPSKTADSPSREPPFHHFRKPLLYSRDDSISSACFPDLTVELARIFPEKRTYK